MDPLAFLRWVVFALAFFALHAIPTALYADHPTLRGANALAVCLLLLQPRRHWPLLLPLLWAAAAGARLWSGAPQPWAVGACNALEVLLAAAVLHGRDGLQTPWYGRAPLRRLLLAAGGVPLVSGALAAGLLGTQDAGAFGPRWLAWSLASMLAYVTLLPLFLGWAQMVQDRRPGGRPVAWRVAGIVLITAACVAALRQELHAPLLLLSFPLVVLAAWWYRLPGVTTAIGVLAVCGGWLAERHVGALFQFLAPGAAVSERVQVLQLYLGAIVLCSLPFAVLLAKQDALWAELRRKSDARAEFLAAMSHEIRTPMTGVLGMADLLAAQPLGAEQRRWVDALRASGRHLVSVVNDILDFSRIETGKLALEHIDFHLAEVIGEVRSLMHPLARDKGLEFAVHAAPGLPVAVKGDPTRLRQVLLNLAGNAVKFTRSGSVHLHVTMAADAGAAPRCRFEVRDTGVGIAADKLAQLFQPFTQADRSTVREFGGSGLGLAISARLAAAMGGRIDARSVPGEGSVFTLEVPLPPGDPACRPAAGPLAQAAPVPRRILVAEDVEINRDILRLALAAQGHQVSFAHDGAAALAMVQRQDFDLVLMDVQMPVMDGAEATQRIRALPDGRGTLPIIGLTANVMGQEQARYLRAGMDECLAKPIEWDRLAAVIARYGAGTAGAIAPPPSEAPPMPGRDTPLLDEGQLEALGRMAGGATEFRELLASCIASVERTLAEVRAAADAHALAGAAHRLKGSAGMVGMARVGALAGLLEQAGAPGDASALRAALDEAARQTRAALAAREAPADAPATPAAFDADTGPLPVQA